MDDPVPQLRKCIMCSKQFKSKSAGHRICGKCRQDYNKVSQRNIPLKPIVIERDN